MEIFLKGLFITLLAVSSFVIAAKGKIRSLAGILIFCVLSVNLGMLFSGFSVVVRLVLSAVIFAGLYLGADRLFRSGKK